jgi:hypothetical protein
LVCLLRTGSNIGRREEGNKIEREKNRKKDGEKY